MTKFFKKEQTGMKEFFSDILPKSRNSRIFWTVALIIMFLLGWGLSNSKNDPGDQHTSLEESPVSQTTIWTCSMHPQIQQPKPGKCPICGMDLIPVSTDTGKDNPRQLTLSQTARKLAEVETVPVRRDYVSRDIRMVGKIEYDETRVKYITSWVPGRIDRLYVNYEGIPVRKGDHLADLYSPELLSTQQEFIESLKTLENLGEMSDMVTGARTQVEATRERLRLWGLTRQQISELEQNRNPSDQITIYSPSAGIIIEKNALEGSYVNTGTRIYTIADLSRVWVLMDAYESDLPWLHFGQEVEFSTEAYPGELFKGRVSFIDPILNRETRTVKLRVNLKNPENKLKPDMFVRATVHARLAAGGKVMDPDLAGKWISPMHPEVVKDHPGTCDVCGMDLVKAEDLGYVSTENVNKEAPLIIPASAPLITGKRAVVYVAVPGKEGTYEGREITLGPRADDYYIVEGGLNEGESVVVKGNFKIDSAIQIKAGRSMMNPEGKMALTRHQNGTEAAPQQKTSSNKKNITDRFSNLSESFLNQLDEVYGNYFEIQNALSHDSLNPALSAAAAMEKSLSKVQVKLVSGDVRETWNTLSGKLKDLAGQIHEAATIEAARQAFQHLSNAIIETAHAFGSSEHRLLVYHCPMAFDFKGADWLQKKEGTENPYFGSSMFTCGDQTADLTEATVEKTAAGNRHE